MLGQFKKKLKTQLVGEVVRLQENALALSGLAHARHVRSLPDFSSLKEAEFRVFSQFGEDGILQYLVAKTQPTEAFFVEIGVQTYVESNTRFLVFNDYWTGGLVDVSKTYIDLIRKDEIAWRYGLRTVCANVSAENIEDVLRQCEAPKNLGLLSIDVDGNDYWLLEKVQNFRPVILVCEYNSLFGAEHAVTIPYQPNFDRTTAHYSNLYFGVSLAALCELAAQKGYVFAGANSAGNNAFFVLREFAGRLKTYSAQEGFIPAKFRESRDAQGQNTFLGRAAALDLIQDCDLVDTRTGRAKKVKDLAR